MFAGPLKQTESIALRARAATEKEDDRATNEEQIAIANRKRNVCIEIVKREEVGGGEKMK